MEKIELNKKVKLSPHFTLGELCKTSVNSLDGNIPSHVAIENLKRLCEWLEHLRAQYNLLYSDGSYWLHFAVRPKENRMKAHFIQT